VTSDDLTVCTCRPRYQVQAGPRRGRLTRTFATLAAARSWKRDTDRAFERGERTIGRAPTVREAAEAWLLAAENGIVLARGDKPYRPSTLRGYRRCMENELFDELGGVRLDQLTRGRLNEYVQSLQARGLAAQTVKNIVIPLRAVYRQALDLEHVTTNPTTGVRVPAGSGRRLRFATPAEIPRLLGALEDRDRPVWATAIYAGLRRGELMALRWSDVDLAAGVIRVQRSYDPVSGQTVDVKTAAGQDRKVPIAGVLRDILLEHRQRAGRGRGLVFARASLGGHCRNAARDQPFSDEALAGRASRAWALAGVAPITLHAGRHTFASLMIAATAAAGIFNPKTVQQMLGHASIQQTYDRYGHLFPGAEEEAGRMLDAFLDSGPDAPSEVAVAWRRLRAALDDEDPGVALPLVADMLAGLESWQHDHGVLPEVTPPGVQRYGRPVTVQRIDIEPDQ
jgi:integrase